METLMDHKLPLGRAVETMIDWITYHGAGFFDAFAYGLENLVLGASDVLLWLPPVVLILSVMLYALGKQKRVGLCVFAGVSLALILNLGYWQEMIETLILVLFSTFSCILIGIPIGIAAAHRPWLYTLLRPILDLMQTIPTFVYLIPTLTLFGLGVVPGLISTVIFAIAAPIRLTYLGISEVPKDLVEAGKSFGCTRKQLLFKIELPSAMPSIMAGVTQCIMLSLSMVVIAALVGADGLGKPVVQALNTVDIAKGFEAGLAIVLLAILIDRLLKGSKSQQEVYS
jgi:glycine betaine/proline transport system permease protein